MEKSKKYSKSCHKLLVPCSLRNEHKTWIPKWNRRSSQMSHWVLVWNVTWYTCTCFKITWLHSLGQLPFSWYRFGILNVPHRRYHVLGHVQIGVEEYKMMRKILELTHGRLLAKDENVLIKLSRSTFNPRAIQHS